MKEYGHQYDQGMDTHDTNKVRIHSHNINNIPQYTTHIKNRSIINEIKQKTADIHLWQETGLCWPKVETRDNWRSRTKELSVHSNLTCNTAELPISSPYQPGGQG